MVRLTVFQMGNHCFGLSFLVLRVDQGHKDLQCGFQVAFPIAQDFQPARGIISLPRHDVPVPKAVLGSRHGAGVTVLAFAQGFFGPFLFGDVVDPIQDYFLAKDRDLFPAQ